MAKTKRYTFVVSAKMAKQRFTGFVDMLRYDSATVIDGAGNSLFVLQTTGHEPTAGRWASFGIHVLAQMEGDYPDIAYLRSQATPKLPLS
jgi:hypothetical protein